MMSNLIFSPIHARYVISMLAKMSVPETSRAKRICGSFNALIEEMSPYLCAKQVPLTPKLFDQTDSATATFIEDFNRARRLLDSLKYGTVLDEADRAVLSATLSWRTALHNSQLKSLRRTVTDKFSAHSAENDKDVSDSLIGVLGLKQ